MFHDVPCLGPQSHWLWWFVGPCRPSLLNGCHKMLGKRGSRASNQVCSLSPAQKRSPKSSIFGRYLEAQPRVCPDHGVLKTQFAWKVDPVWHMFFCFQLCKTADYPIWLTFFKGVAQPPTGLVSCPFVPYMYIYIYTLCICVYIYTYINIYIYTYINIYIYNKNIYI